MSDRYVYLTIGWNSGIVDKETDKVYEDLEAVVSLVNELYLKTLHLDEQRDALYQSHRDLLERNNALEEKIKELHIELQKREE